MEGWGEDWREEKCLLANLMQRKMGNKVGLSQAAFNLFQKTF